MVDLLLDNGAYVNVQDDDGMSALMKTVGDAKSTDKLLQYGADVYLLSIDGWSALMMACIQGNIETVQLLLDKLGC